MTKDVAQRFRYFQNAGIGGQVGHNATRALQLARAEAALAQSEGWRARWEHDQDPDVSWMDERQSKDYREGNTEMLVCLVERLSSCEHSCGYHRPSDERWEVVGVLGGIHIGGNHSMRERDRRMFEAEVALEAGILD